MGNLKLITLGSERVKCIQWGFQWLLGEPFVESEHNSLLLRYCRVRVANVCSLTVPGNMSFLVQGASGPPGPEGSSGWKGSQVSPALSVLPACVAFSAKSPSRRVRNMYTFQTYLY